MRAAPDFCRQLRLGHFEDGELGPKGLGSRQLAFHAAEDRGGALSPYVGDSALLSEKQPTRAIAPRLTVSRRNRYARRMSNDFDRELGDRLEMMREERGLSLAEASNETGVDRSTLRKYEKGRRTLYAQTLFAIVAGYRRSLAALDGLVKPGLARTDRALGEDTHPRASRKRWKGARTGRDLDDVTRELREARDEQRGR